MYPVRVLRRFNCYVISLLCLVCVTIVILHTDFAPDLYFLHWESLEDNSCHYQDSNDDLPVISSSVEMPEKSIFFHETSCKSGLDSRQACAVEAAARAHPKWQVNVLISAPIKGYQRGGSLSVLRKFRNVKLWRLKIWEYAKGTPLQDMVFNGALNRTRWRISHASDLLRYLSLYKYGGVYLDLDTVVAKALDPLPKNWSARESDENVASGIMSFSRDHVGRMVANATIKDFELNYRGDVWGNNGPGVITRVLKDICSTTSVTEMAAEKCQGFEVFSPKLFYPISWMDAEDYFKATQPNVDDPYVYHVWNKLTHNMVVGKNAFYSRLAAKYCPSIYKLYGDSFGL